MLYRDLLQFEPIESIIQLREADDKREARHLVETYVISDRMAGLLVDLVFPQLQIDTPRDNKGILIVGNYGTGKSHLMSVISSLAEYPDLRQQVTNDEVRQAAEPIAGRFKVARVEIGGVTLSLRDILLGELEEALASWGVDYTFPPADQVGANNKDIIIQAIAAFQEEYPDHGLLLAVDELLDFLRSREERELILDLNFLREVGEVAALTPFRFIGGLQETLFDNPRFGFVADQLRRVRDRFEQVRITRQDIAYVVSHRLLRKDDEQLAWITEHLRAFTPLYHDLAERLQEYARLYPIHPAYIETFEAVYVAEKREILKTFSQAITRLLDKEVPAERPGIISYDHYWQILHDNPSMRSIEDVAQVIDKSDVLAGRVRNAFGRPHLLQMAQRIIEALSVHRLTTGGIRNPIGPTPAELRDNLFLHVELPEPTAEFLLGQVQVALNEIMRTVSGQFISHNEESGQYYLDIDKVIDFDAKIAERGAMLGAGDLNRYFFNALRQTLGLETTTYVTNFRIWLHQLPWASHNVMRPGYLFFGLPNDRSTAQPPRDFYLYVLPPFGRLTEADKKGTEQMDEVIFELVGLDQEFEQIVRTYAGAQMLAAESADYRQTYRDKAEDQLRLLNRWLRDRLVSHLHVIYDGNSRPAAAILRETRSSASAGLREFIDLIAAHLLDSIFAEKYPDYPTFTRIPQPVTLQALPNTAIDAVRALAGRGRTNLAAAVLEGLALVDDEGTIRPYQSPYARHFLELLQSKSGPQEVVNRGELIETIPGGIHEALERDLFFKMEVEWVIVVLLALVYHGDIILSFGGRDTLDAGNIDQAATMAMADLTAFRHYKRPKTLDVPAWTAIFELLGLTPGQIRNEGERAEGVKELQRVVSTELKQVAELQSRVQRGLKLWNARLFTDLDQFMTDNEGWVAGGETEQVGDEQLSTTDLTGHLRRYKGFLETLSRYDTIGKLRNLKLSVGDVEAARQDRQVVARTEMVLELVNTLQPLAVYLVGAEGALPPGHEWVERAQVQRHRLLDDVRRLARGEEAPPVPEMVRGLERLKDDYVEIYAAFHRQMVLGPQEDRRRRRLYDDERLQALEQLAEVDLLDRAELEAWKQGVTGLRAAPGFHEGVLHEEPVYHNFRPGQYHTPDFDAGKQLDYFDERLDALLRRWQQALRAGLESETARRSLEAMGPPEKKPLQQFLELPDTSTEIPEGFAQEANRALRGIHALSLDVESLLEALREGGLPTTKKEMLNRFEGFLNEATRGHDERNTRLTLQEHLPD